MVDKGIWEELRSLKDPTGKHNVSYHARQAFELYLKVLAVEDKELFENLKRSEARQENTCI